MQRLASDLRRVRTLAGSLAVVFAATALYAAAVQPPAAWPAATDSYAAYFVAPQRGVTA